MRTSFPSSIAAAGQHKLLGNAKKVRLEYAIYLEALPMRSINVGSIDYRFSGD